MASMLHTIAHRGPDGRGMICSAEVALGHHRLSIIDIDGGYQPLSNEDGTIWVTFNGEIYNYRELRQRLASRGHRFRTKSDTEVIVHAYEEYGLDFVEHLNGMFAFALHDRDRRSVILARDHLGIKPLFYSETPEGLFFASEIKAVLAGAGQEAAVSPQSLQEYLVFRYVAWSRTFFDRVRRLPPGHLAVWKDGRLNVKRYWHLPIDDSPRPPTLEEAGAALDAHLSRAVSMQMVSDVPLGTFCSGGVDSGVVTRYAARVSEGPLQTFSVGFDEPSWDETALAQDTSRRLGTAHNVYSLQAEEFAGALRKLIWYNDEPLSHPNSVPLYFLSRLSRQKVKVILTGEGADELFAGYPRYHIARLSSLLDGLPAVGRELAARIVGFAPGHRARLLARLLPCTFRESLLLNSAYVSPRLVAELTGAPVAEALDERRGLLSEGVRSGDPIASMCRYELLTYVVCALDRMDRMAMANGLETRVPFLDVPLVEWGVNLPASLKLKRTECKRVLKHLASDWLNPRIVWGAKSGFGIPLADWFRGPAFAHEVRQLRDHDHPAAAHFDRNVLRRILDEHLSGTHDHGEVLWLLTNVYAWHTVDFTRALDESGEAELAEARGLSFQS